MSPKKFYLTTPIYYVNARPHIGHAYTTIVADVLARRHRLLGDDTFFLTGTDEHGQKIERSAQAAGIPPQQFADQVSKSFEDLWKRMGITNDRYIRTTDARHKQGVQKLFSTLYENGFIELKAYTGTYCVSDETFVDVPAGTPCPDCGRITETVTEENFFFKLSAFQRPLIDLIESDTLQVENEARKNEVLSFLRGNVQAAADANLASATTNLESNTLLFAEQTETGAPGPDSRTREPLLSAPASIAHSTLGIPYVEGALKDLSVSRSSFTWGIPVPEPAASAAAQKHVIYVWLDALANYMTAVGYGSDSPADQTEFQKYWPADLHLVGKEIIRFHCVYWPAFLLAAGLPLPEAITAHGWLLFDNSKMSKSKGNIVRTETILDAFGEHVYAKQFPDSTKSDRDLFASDVLRYFLLREIPFGQDGSFSFDALVTRYNADLANGYGNLVSRTLSMIEKYFAGEVPTPRFEETPTSLTAPDGFDASIVGTAGTALQDLIEASPSTDFTAILTEVAAFITVVDGFISAAAPWKLAKDETKADRLATVLYVSAEAIRWITGILYPYCPSITAKVWTQLGLGSIESAARDGELAHMYWGGLKPGTKLGPLSPIFPRADKGLSQIMTDIENPTEAKPETRDPKLETLTQNSSAASPLKQASTPTPAEPIPTDSTHPAAPPRAIGESNTTLPVAGSSATTTHNGPTPSHTEAQPSGIFANPTSEAPAGPADGSPQITIDDFIKVELRIAQILVAERIPKADKLLRLEVDLGYEKRQILSGIAEWYTPEDLIGRRIIVITNLAPRKMRGLESHGMLLAASEEGGKPYLATVPEGVPIGTRLK